MNVALKDLGVGRVANKIVDRLDSFEKLKEVANKNNYSHKVKRLFERLTEERSFWVRKGDSPRLQDIEKDLNFILTQIGEERIDKVQIDLLIQKYPIN